MGRSKTIKRAIAFTVLLAATVAQAQVAAAQVPPLGYKIHTVLGSIDRVTNATIGVPTAVNVDLTPEPDVIVQAVGTIIPSLTLDISITTIKTLPVAIDLTYEYDGNRLNVGYDPRATATTPASVAPARWDAIVTADAALTSVDLNLLSVLPGRTLRVFGRGETLSGPRTVIDVSALLDPVPTLFRAFGRNNDERAVLDLRPNIPTKITAAIYAILEGKTIDADTTVDSVPDIMSIEVLKRPEPANPMVAMNASAPIASIQATGTVTEPDRVINFTGRLTGVSAPRIEVDPAEDEHVTVRFPSGGAITSTILGFAKNGPIDTTPPAEAGSNDFVKVVRREVTDHLSAYVRVAGLGAAPGAPAGMPIAELGWGDTFIVKLQRRTASNLVAAVDTDELTGRIVLTGLPAWLDVAYKENDRFTFDGAAPLPSVLVNIVSKPGFVLFDRARRLSIYLERIPTDLTLLVQNTRTSLSNKILVTALDKSIGLVDVRIADRASSATVADEGILYIDRSDIWLLHAAVRELTTALYETSGICLYGSCGMGTTVELVAGHTGHPFKIDFTPSNDDQTTINLTHRPGRARFEMVKRENAGGNATRLLFKWQATASPSTSSITLRTPAKARYLQITPIPTRAEFCLDKTSNYCSNHGRAAKTSMSFTTGRSYVDPDSSSDDFGQRLLVNFEQCDWGPCFRQDGNWIRVSNLSIERFRMASKEGSTTEIFLDTGRKVLSGDVEIQDGSENLFNDVRVHLPTGFWADNRRVTVDGSSARGTPAINCPSGTRIMHWIPDDVEDLLASFWGFVPALIHLIFDDEYYWGDISGLICDAEIPIGV